MNYKKHLLATSALLGSIYMTGCLETNGQNALLETQITCPSHTTLISNDFEGKPVCQLKGTYTQDIHLSSDKFWALKGEVHIGIDTLSNTTLSIDPGTTIFGKTGGDFLLVTRGSKIMAEGTRDKPIVFTSMKDVAGLLSKAGDWGGIAIAGKAPTNAGQEESFEFSDTNARFGGTDPHDNSGILKYVKILYAGYEVRPAEELNGLSLGGVGSGTTIDYVEVYNGKDDGIEAWGGTVNMSHLVLIGNGDDNLDFDHGYQGNVDHVYIKQTHISSIHGRGIETDNNKKYNNAKPRTLAHVSNFEIVANKQTSEAVFSRRGSGLKLSNGLIKNSGGLGIVVKSSGKERFETNQFENVYVQNTKRSSVKDSSSDNKNLETFNAQFHSSIEENVALADKLVGAYTSNHDWRQGWSILD